jgi:hypothetical protein
LRKTILLFLKADNMTKKKTAVKPVDPKPAGTFFGLKRFRLLGDDDGHDYLVEVGKEEAFRKWIDAGPYWKNYTGEEFESIGSAFSCYTFADPRITRD